nr:immunoglobulin heavy chain junction region [Mus musculus]MBK4186233.1 immunoglobulin heavy chain junction region [Mus musculus]MBK4186251.1 immunoglobulin heavy chain junction region [Mus musculus]
CARGRTYANYFDYW